METNNIGNRKESKRGFFFSLDSFMGLILFVLTLAIVYSFFVATHSLQQEFFISEDLLNVFTNVKIDELDLSKHLGISALIPTTIENTDVLLIEEIFILYDKDQAENPVTTNSETFVTDIVTDEFNVPSNNNRLVPVQYEINVLLQDALDPNKDNLIYSDLEDPDSRSSITRQRLISEPVTTTLAP
ncbi:hypothetical protein CL617_01275 [archaeon]|nr:hypothetical protein [archaeon]|tara:strand:- start:579 stop:1136 length:558 start_codon:yes stop_codon:yes gene_type:complete